MLSIREIQADRYDEYETLIDIGYEIESAYADGVEAVELLLERGTRRNSPVYFIGMHSNEIVEIEIEIFGAVLRLDAGAHLYKPGGNCVLELDEDVAQGLFEIVAGYIDSADVEDIREA